MRSVSRKQKLNHVPNAQCIPSAPTLANTMLVEDFIVVVRARLSHGGMCYVGRYLKN